MPIVNRETTMQGWKKMFVMAFAALALVACSGGDAPQFRNSNITGSNFGHGFDLMDHTGQRRTLADFKGKAVSIFFGYVNCPDVCPTNLITMRQVMEQLGPDATRMQVLFVTVDPERDTAELLSRYVPAFDGRFLGLYGTLEETAAVAKDFKVVYRKSGDVNGPNYTVDHSAGTYIFDPAGKLRLYVRHGETADNIAHDVKMLLDGV